MVEIEQLKGHHKEGFGKFINEPSKEQLNLYFYLNDSDKEVIAKMKKSSTKLGFAVQLGTVRFLGCFTSDFETLPIVVIQHLAAQLNIDYKEFYGYTRKQTIWQHMKLIQDYYNYVLFTDNAVEKYLSDWLLDRSWYTTETDNMLFDMLLKKCLDEKIILPGFSTFERFVSKIIDSSEKQLYKLLSEIPATSEVERLLELFDFVGEPIRGATLKMDILRSPLIDESQKELIRGFNRLIMFQSFHTENWDFSVIPEGKLKKLASYAFKAKAQAIQRMPLNRQIAHLVAFVYEHQKKAMDEQLLALSKYVDAIFRRAKNKEIKDRMRTIKDLDRAALTLSKIVELLFDESITNQEIRKVISDKFQKEEMDAAIFQVKDIVRNEQEPIAINELRKAFRKIKKFIPSILLSINFEGNNYGADSLVVWEKIKEVFPKPITLDHFYDIEPCLSKKWQYYIHENPTSVNQCVLIAGLELLFQGLKKHDIFVTNSEKYADPMSYLLDDSTWIEQREVLITQLDLPSSGTLAVQKLSEDLSLSFIETQSNWDASNMARLEEINGELKVVVSNLKKGNEQPNEKEFKSRVRQLMPSIDLSDLLLEVNQRVGLTQSFKHLNEKESRMKQLDISILAVLLAESCNIGFSPVSKNNIDSLKYDRLTYVAHQYLRIDTLTAANQKIIHSHKKLELALAWGNGEMASADGIRYITPQRSLYSASNPKYFGKGRGITFYNFVSDHYIGFHGMVVSGTLRDSLYLLEGLLNQTSGLQPTQIMTDTAGYSDLIFGLFGLLGFQFSPRIANKHGTKLWRIEKNADYGLLNDVTKSRINTDLIEEHWEDILRVAGSLKSGKVNATELTRALQRSGQPTSLGKAITEYGKVYKTKHQLRYLSDEIYARQILEQLNKGESRHALCRSIFYGRNGKLYQTYIDGMEEQLTSLSVVTNAVIYWNTLYLEKVLEQMKVEGYDCSEELIGKLSPLLFEHINFVGKYSFQYNQGLEDGSLRPLKTPDSL